MDRVEVSREGCNEGVGRGAELSIPTGDIMIHGVPTVKQREDSPAVRRHQDIAGRTLIEPTGERNYIAHVYCVSVEHDYRWTICGGLEQEIPVTEKESNISAFCLARHRTATATATPPPVDECSPLQQFHRVVMSCFGV
jgi:hypothetical protein